MQRPPPKTRQTKIEEMIKLTKEEIEGLHGSWDMINNVLEACTDEKFANEFIQPNLDAISSVLDRCRTRKTPLTPNKPSALHVNK